MKFEKIKPGMELLDIHKTVRGSTLMTELGCWKVIVKSVDPVSRTAMCSWNGNPATRYSEKRLKNCELSRQEHISYSGSAERPINEL
jgi:hypothetical protein